MVYHLNYMGKAHKGHGQNAGNDEGYTHNGSSGGNQGIHDAQSFFTNIICEQRSDAVNFGMARFVFKK